MNPVDPGRLDNRKLHGLNREMVYERLPKHLQATGETTVKDAALEVIGEDEPPDAAHVDLWLAVTDKVKQGLDALVDAGYAERAEDDDGHLIYSWAGQD